MSGEAENITRSSGHFENREKETTQNSLSSGDQLLVGILTISVLVLDIFITRIGFKWLKR